MSAWREICAVLLLSFSALPVVGSNVVTLWGNLTVVDDRGPVAGAVIELEATSFRYKARMISDDKGRFARVGLPAGRYDATFTREGFAAVEIESIEAKPGRRLRIDVAMTPLDEAPFKVERRRYRPPIVESESATIEMRYP